MIETKNTTGCASPPTGHVCTATNRGFCIECGNVVIPYHLQALVDRTVAQLKRDYAEIWEARKGPEEDIDCASLRQLLRDWTGIAVEGPCTHCNGGDKETVRLGGGASWLNVCEYCEGRGVLDADEMDRKCLFCAEDNPRELKFWGAYDCPAWVCGSSLCQSKAHHEERMEAAERAVER